MACILYMRIASSVLKWKGSESWKADRILSQYATRFHLNPFLNPPKLGHISIKPVPDFVHGVLQLWHHHIRLLLAMPLHLMY